MAYKLNAGTCRRIPDSGGVPMTERHGWKPVSLADDEDDEEGDDEDEDDDE
jgi:hypothetical protein